MKISHYVSLLLLTAGFLIVTPGQATAQSDEAAIQEARSLIKADRQAVVAEALQLTETESEAFWPLYHQYRAELDKVGDGLVTLVKEYASTYPNVPDDRAKTMLKEFNDLEKKRVATRTAFLKKFGKTLPAAKNLRFAQVEHRLDLAVQLKLASEIPLVPIEGRLSADAVGAGAVVEGVPGGAFVQTSQLTVTVAAIDKAKRKVTLVSPEGIKKTVKAGPEVINFDQIKVGDQLKITVTEELVVKMAGPGESADDGADGLVALAPKGAKPGGLMAETVQITATVQAIDVQGQKVTLQFPDGASQVLPVRRDVNLSARKVGEKVVIRRTEALAISVSKP